MVNLVRNNQKHGFHLVDPSPWPLIAAFSALMLTFGGVLYMHGYAGGGFLWRFGFLMILFMMYVWWRDIIREGTFEGQHTSIVQLGLRMGMLLFIVSEIMFFFAFFWAFFHSSFNPSPAIGGVWPPAFITILDPWKVPFIKHCNFVNFRCNCYLGSSCYCMGFKVSSRCCINCYYLFSSYFYCFTRI